MWPRLSDRCGFAVADKIVGMDLPPKMPAAGSKERNVDAAKHVICRAYGCAMISGGSLKHDSRPGQDTGERAKNRINSITYERALRIA